LGRPRSERGTTQLRGAPHGRRLGGCPATAGEPGASRAPYGPVYSALGFRPFGGRLGEDTDSACARRARTVPGSLGSLWGAPRVPVTAVPGGARAVPQPLYNAAGGAYTHASSRPVARQYAAASPGQSGSNAPPKLLSAFGAW